MEAKSIYTVEEVERITREIINKISSLNGGDNKYVVKTKGWEEDICKEMFINFLKGKGYNFDLLGLCYDRYSSVRLIDIKRGSVHIGGYGISKALETTFKEVLGLNAGSNQLVYLMNIPSDSKCWNNEENKC